MRVKCTIEIDGDTFSAQADRGSDGIDDDKAVARVVASCLGAIDSVDGNLLMTSMIAETCLAAWGAPTILRSAAEVWLQHNIEKNGTDGWEIVVDSDVWEEAPPHRRPLFAGVRKRVAFPGPNPTPIEKGTE